MKIHFGKQWRQLEKCIIQCQETAQGSKPEPQPGTDWSVSTYLLLEMSGGGESLQHIFHRPQLSFTLQNTLGTFISKITAERHPLGFASQHEEMLTLGHNKRPASSGLRQCARVETGIGTSEEQTQSILNYPSPLQLLGKDQDLLTRWRITLHGFWNAQGLAAVWTASFNSLVSQQSLLRLNSLPAPKYFIPDYFSLWRVSSRCSN